MSALYPILSPSSSRVASAFGMTLLAAADEATARTTLGVDLSLYLPLTGGTLSGNLLSTAQIRGSALRSDSFNSYDNGYSLLVVDSGDGKVHIYGNGASVLHLESAKIQQRNGATSQTFESFHSYTDASNYQGGRLAHSAGVFSLAAISAGTGADDVDVSLEPAGSGRVRFGGHSALGAETVTGFITIKDSGGTERKLAVIS